jgi:hypothetical protein
MRRRNQQMIKQTALNHEYYHNPNDMKLWIERVLTVAQLLATANNKLSEQLQEIKNEEPKTQKQDSRLLCSK